MRRWIAWKEGLAVLPNRAPGVVLLWHALKPLNISDVECDEVVPDRMTGITILRFTGKVPNGMMCTECRKKVDTRAG